MDFLLEIGVEDLPSRFLTPALVDLAALAGEKLSENRLEFGRITSLGTPRRLCVHVAELEKRQPVQVEVKLGPPINVAFDGEGNPTKAAISFAAKFGLTEADLQVIETPKGERIQVEIRTGGAETIAVLPGIAESLISELPLPKSMRWDGGGIKFLRPIRWLLALAGDEIVELKIGEVESERRSRGHRFLADEKFELTDASLEGYLRACHDHFVIPDGTTVDDEGNVARPGERYTLLKGQLEELLERHGGVSFDTELLLEVTNMVEYPHSLEGGFEHRFLALPEAVVVSTLREYQKYFEVRDGKGNLLPRFIAVRDGDDRNARGVIAGHERVLRARLTDAAYFWEQSKKKPLEEKTDELADLQFIKALGSYGDKRSRLVSLVGLVNSDGVCDGDTDVLEHLERAAGLAKQDLLTPIVVEFTGLQGLIGGELAREQGEDKAVWRAVAEQYLPKGFSGKAEELPQTTAGCLLALLDRLDTLAGCFATGMQPTGSKDPYGLRRAARGVIGITMGVEGHEPLGFDQSRLDLGPLIDAAIQQYKDVTRKPFDPTEVHKNLLRFILDRVERLFGELGLPTDVVRAAAGAYPTQPYYMWRSAYALAQAKGSEDFTNVAAGFKRARNILKQAKRELGIKDFGTHKEELLKEPDELGLAHWLAFQKESIGKAVNDIDFKAAISVIAKARVAIDNFFDTVLVMDPDPALRNNRLALLNELVEDFSLVGDLSLIRAE
ncbi:glycine--tRNA ligase subunit beta [bacterium]|nr:glycine--tRNA ligase subunit beta [bacterium]